MPQTGTLSTLSSATIYKKHVNNKVSNSIGRHAWSYMHNTNIIGAIHARPYIRIIYNNYVNISLVWVDIVSATN